VNFNEKLAICYTCCGPTYRKSALDKLTNFYFDHPNLYYFVLTDDRTYFKDLQRENLTINELKDFYSEYPEIEEYEFFLESTDEKDYGEKFVKTKYLFPYATMRFHLLQAKEHGITNIALISTDSVINLERFTDETFKVKNKICGTAGWPSDLNDNKIESVKEVVREKYNIEASDIVIIFDEAVRLYILESIDFLMKFFNIWNEVTTELYRNKKIILHRGSYVIHDEFILAVVHHIMGITGPFENWAPFSNIFTVNHNPRIERFWA